MNQPGHRRRRRLLILGLVAALLTVGAIATVLLLPDGTDTSATDATPAVPALNAADASNLAAALTSPDPAITAMVLATDVRSAYQAAPAPLVPAGSTVTIDPATFTTGDQGGYATVEAAVAGPQPARFVLALVHEDDTWRVLASGLR